MSSTKESKMLTFKIKRFNPAVDDEPYWTGECAQAIDGFINLVIIGVSLSTLFGVFLLVRKKTKFS